MEHNVNRFKEMLIEENRRHNLVSRKSIAGELDKHIEDSIKILDFVDLTNEKVVDVGSGAGFPGLILAMYCTHADFTLVEADQKKSLFLKKVCMEMRITNVTVINSRVEELGQDCRYRSSFDICTSRAVAPMNVILEYGLPLTRVGGKLMLWKGRKYQQEIGKSEKALRILGGKMVDIWLYSLMEKRDRTVIVVEKTDPTPDKYPRRVGIPLKRPL